MARRFAGVEEIEWIKVEENKWIKFDPKPYQLPLPTVLPKQSNELPSLNKEFILLAATASYLQKELEDESNPWENSPFEWILKLPARKKGKLARQLVASWLATKGVSCELSGNSSETLVIHNYRFAIKFSTVWATGFYKFQQIRSEGYDYVICLGISPFDAHCWVFDRKYAIKNAKKQHGTEYWMTIDPGHPKDWVKGCGGTLDQAYRALKTVIKQQRS
jgi:hypothetical protein